jgi:hypothetical protein
MRFYAWKVPAMYARYAHCPKCGNFDLQRISRERVDGGKALWLRRWMGISAYRCDPCRERFFSIRKLHRIVPVPYERAVSQSAGH